MKTRINNIELQKHLTPQELLDYSKDVLGNNEMYRIELHLNECELCNDAVEGIVLLNNPTKTVDAIQKSILPNQSKKINFNYLAIAASVTLIAAFGLSYWLLNNNNQTQHIAENTAVKQKEISIKANPSNEVASGSIQITDGVIDEGAVEENSNSIELSTEATKPAEVGVVQSTKQQTVITSKKEEKNQLSVGLIAESSLDNEDYQRASAPTEEALDETLEQEVVQAAPMAARSAKKATAPNTPLKDQKEPTPNGGIGRLKTHIQNNLVYPQQAIDTKTKGTVVLEVTVSANGAIKNIIVIKSVGSGCDAEAMRLITTGPKWQPAVKNGVAIEEKRQVKIKFKN